MPSWLDDSFITPPIGPEQLEPGANGQVLTTTGGVVVWGAGGGGGGSTPTGTGVRKVNAGVEDPVASLVGNADVAGNAAIAGSKVNPDFAAQTVTTTGGVVGGYVTLGNAAAAATTGDVRSSSFVWRALASGTTRVVMEAATGLLAIGSDQSGANQFATVWIRPSTTGVLGAGGVDALSWTSTVVTALRDLNVSTSRALTFGTTPATVGDVRLPNAGSMYWRNSTNTTNIYGVGIGSSGELMLGVDPAYTTGTQASRVRIYGNAGISMGDGAGNTRVEIGSGGLDTYASLNVGAGIAGGGTTPFKYKTASVAPTNGTNTLTSAQYTCPYLVFVGGTASAAFSAVAPLQTGATFIVTNATSFNLTFGGATGGTVVLAANATAMVICDGGGYRMVS